MLSGDQLFFSGTKLGIRDEPVVQRHPHRTSASRVAVLFVFPPPIIGFPHAPALCFSDPCESAITIGVSALPPFLGGDFTHLLAAGLRTEPLPIMTARIRLEPLLATTTLLPTTLFFHRAAPPARSFFPPASKPKPQAIERRLRSCLGESDGRNPGKVAKLLEATSGNSATALGSPSSSLPSVPTSIPFTSVRSSAAPRRVDRFPLETLQAPRVALSAFLRGI